MTEQKCEKCGMSLANAEDKCGCKESLCHCCCECEEKCECGCKEKCQR